MFAAKRKLVESRDFKHFYKYIIFTSEGEDKVPLDNIAKRAEVYKPKERVTYKKRYNIQELSDDENRNNAINDLKMAIPKLKLISKDDGLVKELDKFIH